MAEDEKKPPFTLLKFEPKPVPELTVPAADKAIKIGLYPLGTEDVVISIPTLAYILTALRSWPPEQRAGLAEELEKMFRASFQPPR